PGWSRLKSWAPKPRRSSRATASASPSASMAVVEVVGARPIGQASGRGGSTSVRSAACARVLSARPTIARSAIEKRRVYATMSASSGVSPELDRASTASSAVIMPRSPWLASAGWTYSAGVPVEASVAAILRPTWPLLPMPVTTVRPRVLARRSTACSNRPSSVSARANSASASARRTRRPASSGALEGASDSLGLGNATTDMLGSWFTLLVLSVPVSLRSFVPAGARQPTPPAAKQVLRPILVLAEVVAVPPWSMQRQRRVNVAMRRRPGSSLPRAASVGKDVLVAPARQVEFGPLGQKREARRGERLAALARQHAIEPTPQLVEIEHVAGGVAELRLAQLGGAPVGALHLLRQLDAEQLLAQVPEAVAVGVGAGELGRDLGAVHRATEHAQIVPDGGEIVAREMEQLLARGIGEQPAQIGRAVRALAELHQVAVAVPGRQLHQTQPVALGV